MDHGSRALRPSASCVPVRGLSSSPVVSKKKSPYFKEKCSCRIADPFGIRRLGQGPGREGTKGLRLELAATMVCVSAHFPTPSPALCLFFLADPVASARVLFLVHQPPGVALRRPPPAPCVLALHAFLLQHHVVCSGMDRAGATAILALFLVNIPTLAQRARRNSTQARRRDIDEERQSAIEGGRGCTMLSRSISPCTHAPVGHTPPPLHPPNSHSRS